MEGDAIPNLVGISGAMVLLVLAVRVFFRQGDEWQDVLAAAKDDARQARHDASTARAEVEAMRLAEQQCRTQIAEQWVRIAELERRLAEHEGD